MNVHNRVVKIERALNIPDSETNPLPIDERVKTIFIHRRELALQNVNEEDFIQAEQGRILRELHEKFGEFDENMVEWIAVTFVDPSDTLRGKGIQFEN